MTTELAPSRKAVARTDDGAGYDKLVTPSTNFGYAW
jgi:hypothetical protein